MYASLSSCVEGASRTSPTLRFLRRFKGHDSIRRCRKRLKDGGTEGSHPAALGGRLNPSRCDDSPPHPHNISNQASASSTASSATASCSPAPTASFVFLFASLVLLPPLSTSLLLCFSASLRVRPSVRQRKHSGLKSIFLHISPLSFKM